MYPLATRDETLALVERGLSLSEISRRLGVSRATIRIWRDGLTRPRRVECPICDGETLNASAYAALLGYYLGDGHVSRTPRYLTLRVTCDRKYPVVIADVRDAITGVRPRANVFEVAHGTGALDVTVNWQHWGCLFPQHGPGRKHERDIRLEPWQRAIVTAHPAAFLRGLFHSDGSRVANWTRRTVNGEPKRYEYPRWQFTNYSEDIMALCTWALDLLSIPWRRSNPVTVSVSRREAVRRLDDLIGTKAGSPRDRTC